MKKTIKEILILVAVLIVLNVTGLLGEVTGFLQRGLFYTGLLNANVEKLENAKEADYNFTMTTLDGEQVSFTEFKGKVVFLNLWATWCGPCIAEMPGIQNLYDKVEKDDIVFVMLSLDETTDKVQKFVDRKEFDFPVYMASHGVPDVFRTGSIPTTHIISPEGKIIYTKKGTANYNTEKFKEFLGKQVNFPKTQSSTQ
ncbi:MAG: TlpA family protein disulfide reductase [Candidatus Cyclobacteriaceae bacterium M2_1C_046]